METLHNKIIWFRREAIAIFLIILAIGLYSCVSNTRNNRDKHKRLIRDYIENVLQTNGIECVINKAYYTEDKRILIYFQLNPEFPYWIDKYYVILRGPNDACEEELIVFDKDKDYESFCKLHRISLYTLKCEWE